MLQKLMYLVPIIKTSEKFLSKKLLLKRSPLATKGAALPRYLSSPLVSEYA
jgi:hypothetical protein